MAASTPPSKLNHYSDEDLLLEASFRAKKQRMEKRNAHLYSVSQAASLVFAYTEDFSTWDLRTMHILITRELERRESETLTATGTAPGTAREQEKGGITA